MRLTRRRLLTTATAFAVAGTVPAQAFATRGPAASKGKKTMHGLIGKMNAVPGQRDALIAILLESVHEGMPGCLSYVVAEDPADADAIWITEVWDSAQSHQASLALPAVREAIARAKPLIAGFGDHVQTRPVDGYGLRRHA